MIKSRKDVVLLAEKILLIKQLELPGDYYDYDRFCFGDYDGLSKPDHSINLQKIFGVPEKIDVVSHITIAYCTVYDDGLCYITSVFRNADIYKWDQYYDPYCAFYHVKSQADDVFNVPQSERSFNVKFDGEYLYTDDIKIRRYAESICVPHNCVKFDDSIVADGLKKAGNDILKLQKLFEEVFRDFYQTKKSEPIIRKMLSLTRNDDVMESYGRFLRFSNKPKEALKIYTDLYNKNKEDDCLILMALANLDLGYNREMVALLDKVSDKERIKDFGIDYEILKKTMPYVSNAEYIDEREIIKYAVSLSFEEMPLPETIKIDGKKKFLDPIRKKGVPITPEENVRQRVLLYLLDKCKVPISCIVSEDSLSHYTRGSLQRADITVRTNAETLLLVECKEENISLDGDPIHQIMEYNKTIHSHYLLLTNGIYSYIFHCLSDGRIKPLMDLPSFEMMCRDAGITAPTNNITTKHPDVSEFDKETVEYYRNDGRFLGVDTPIELASPILNFAWFFLDTSHKLENIKGYGCEIFKDCGIVNTKVSDASGGGFWGEFRRLLVKDRFGKVQSVCFSVFGVLSEESRGGYTSLVSGIEIEGQLISKLQVMFDRCLKKTYDEHYILEHSGVRSRKSKQSMIDYAQKCCPGLVRNGKIYLGKFDNSKNFTGDLPDIRDFLARLVSYVILRKELALIEKKRR